MSTINEIFETFQNRVKSPIFGSITLSFLACNWKPIYFVLFADGWSPEGRFDYFDEHTTWVTLAVLPVLLGIVLAIGLPYANYWTTVAINQPVQKRRLLELHLASQRLQAKQNFTRLRRLEEEEHDKALIEKRERREQELIDQAQREQEILKIENEEVRSKLLAEIETLRQNNHVPELSEVQQMINVLTVLINRLSKELSPYDKTKMFSEKEQNYLRKTYTAEVHGALSKTNELLGIGSHPGSDQQMFISVPDVKGTISRLESGRNKLLNVLANDMPQPA